MGSACSEIEQVSHNNGVGRQVMRIALFHNTPTGGAKRAIHEWTSRLNARHCVDAFTLSTSDHSFCDIRPHTNKYTVFDFSPNALFRSPWGRLNQLQRWRDLGALIRLGKTMARIINSGPYDILFAHTCIFTFIPTLLPFVKIPTVYYLHEPFGPYFVRPASKSDPKPGLLRRGMDALDPLLMMFNRRLEFVQRRSVRHTTRMLANSRFTSEQMKRCFRVETPVCYCGVNAETFHPMPGIDKEYSVLSVGELSARKGFDFIIESLGKMAPQQRPKLVLACNSVHPREASYIESLAVRNAVDLEILFNLSAAELAVQYNKAMLCVYAPILEPFGLVPLEAMACGTPVLGVREGGVQESIDHENTGLLVDRDLDQFSTALQRMLSNPALLSAYGRNSRAHVLNHWSWDQSLASIESHLIECACGTPGVMQ
jgi:glycosyltransferase involved in cell wall biosynthesis